MNNIISLMVRYWVLLFSTILLVITTLSLMPLDQLPDVPGTDKTHHFIAYGVLMFVVALRNPRFWFFILIFFMAWSGAIELIQPYVNRYGEWLDMLANTGGLIFGVVLGFFARKFLPVINFEKNS